MCVVQCAPRHILILSTNLFPFVVLCPTRIRTPGFSRRTPLTITMSHFGRSGPPDIRDTYSLLVLNITFRIFLSFFLFFFFFWFFCWSIDYFFQFIGTTADDLYPLFDRYGKVVDVFIPRDRRLVSVLSIYSILFFRVQIYF